MMRELTSEEAAALSSLLSVIRPDWDIPGIRTVLWNAKSLAPAPDLICAAVRAAADENIRTPGVIGQPGRHWRHETQVAPRFERPPDSKRCSVCSQPFNDCRAKWSDDHEFESIVDNRRAQSPPPDLSAVRAEIAESSRVEADHG